jgi:protease-4
MEKLLAQRGAKDEGKDADPFRRIGMYDYLAQNRQAPAILDHQAKVAVVVAQGEINSGQAAAGHDRRRVDFGADPQGARGRGREGARPARGFARRRGVSLRADPPRDRADQGRRQAGRGVDGQRRGLGRLLDLDECDKIYADPSTITGSIGIFGLWMSVPKTLEKIGVHSDGVGTTPLAGVFDPTRPLDPNAGTMIQSVIDHGYAQFIGKVAQARHSVPEKIDTVARGRVWSGAQAKERGLVDVLGGLAQAQDEAARLAKLDPKGYEVQYVETPLSGLEQLFLDMSKRASLAGIVRTLGPGAALLRDEDLERGAQRTVLVADAARRHAGARGRALLLRPVS